ncbi:MFS transporter [Phytoactinopolyspora limicola]|uniref:MFS transporter n=1 Tax=Phytoactinopolyspora limicola TaxID=2715536 RepID=UPI001409B7C8|nr:MFS transporter [Phytoactinopolyspora limicola]
MATSTTSSRRPVGSAPERLFTPAFVGLTVADLAYFTAIGMSFLLLPHYVTGPVGSGTAGAGIAFGAFAVTALALRPVAGRLTDTVGRRPLLVAGAALCAICMVATAHVDTLAAVVAIRLLLGVAEAAFFVASFAAVADLAPPSRVGEALSYNSLGLYLGIAGGPLLGEFVMGRWGFTTAWHAAAGLALFAVVAALYVGETRVGQPVPGHRPRLIHVKALPPALGFFASVVAMGVFLAFAALHADDVGMARTGTPLIVYGGVVVVSRIAFARVHDRFPPLILGAAALVTIASGLMVIALWAAPAGVVLGAVLLALGVTFSTPAFFAAIFATAEPSERGAASGTASVFLDLGIGGGPILLGFVATAMGLPWAFGVAAVVALAGGAWTLSLRTPGHNQRREESPVVRPRRVVG